MRGDMKMVKKFDLFEDIELTNEQKEYFKYADMTNEIIVQLINRRLELDITQRKLAEKTGIKQPMIARIERFESIPRIDTVVKIAYALGLTMTFKPQDDSTNGLSACLFRANYDEKIKEDISKNMYLCEKTRKYNEK